MLRKGKDNRQGDPNYKANRKEIPLLLCHLYSTCKVADALSDQPSSACADDCKLRYLLTKQFNKVVSLRLHFINPKFTFVYRHSKFAPAQPVWLLQCNRHKQYSPGWAAKAVLV